MRARWRSTIALGTTRPRRPALRAMDDRVGREDHDGDGGHPGEAGDPQQSQPPAGLDVRGVHDDEPAGRESAARPRGGGSRTPVRVAR